MAKRKKKDEPPDDQGLREIYEESRKNFTAAQLQKFTVIEKGIPAEKVLAEMKKIHCEVSRKRS
jgi:hypothetical protein